MTLWRVAMGVLALSAFIIVRGCGYEFGTVGIYLAYLALHVALPGTVALYAVKGGPISIAQAFALGLPALYVRGFDDSSGPFTYQELTAFAQDDWRLTSRLTLKAGLRYQVQIWPDTETTVASLAGTSLRYPFPQDRNNLAPRLGMSFNLDRNGRSSIDVAYGRVPAAYAIHRPGAPRVAYRLRRSGRPARSRGQRRPRRAR